MVTIKREISINQEENFKEKIKIYFDFYNFELKENSEIEFEYYKKGSILDGWKLNPLNWKSHCKIHQTSSKTIEVTFTNEGNATLSPKVFEMTFNTFTSNLAEFITKNKDFVDSNQKSINKAKKRILIIFLAIITFAILGNFVGNYFSKILGGGNLFSFLGIIIGGNLVLKLTNNYFSKNSTNKITFFS